MRLLSPSVRPVDPLVRSLEAEIRAELRAREATLAFRKRREEELIAEIRYLYFRAENDPECRKRLLRLNDLPEDLPVHAEDSVEESLQPLLWNSGKRLLQLAAGTVPTSGLQTERPSAMRLRSSFILSMRSSTGSTGNRRNGFQF